MAPPPDDPRSDRQLIAAINRGEPDAFDALYRRYRRWVVNLARRFVGDENLALDVMQETFLYVLGKFPGFRLTARFTTFLYPVVKHIAARQQHKARRYAADDEAALARAEADPRAAGSESLRENPHEQHEDLAALMARLPEHQRETLLLRFVDGFSLKEIAEATEVPLGTVKSRLHLGLKTLREDPATKNFFDR